MKVKAPITVAIDPVLGIKPKEMVMSKVREKIQEDKTVGVYVRPWKNMEQIADELAPVLDHMGELGYSVYMIPMYYSEDMEAAEMVASKVKVPVKVIDRELTIDEAVAYTAEFDMIIGMRLHSLIMAGAVGTPMIALSYDPKVRGFIKEMKLSYCIDTENIDRNDLITMVDELTNQLEIERANVSQSYLDHKEKIYLPAKHIKELLK